MNLFKRTLFFIAFLPLALFSQQNFRRVDSLMLSCDSSSIESIAHFVNASFPSDTDKVRAYYRWITANIDYDVDLMLAMSNGEEADHDSQNPDTVLERRIAVCEGYSRLMQKFCEASSIPCEIIPGYSKTSENEKVMDLFHAWNAVKVNGQWQLVDVTWASDYLDALGEYDKVFNGNYFMTPPSVFAKDHLPLDPMWQLSDQPLTKNGFFENNNERIGDYNFCDSLTNYLTENQTKRHYTDVMHYHLYDPTNIRFSRALDVIHNNIAAHYLIDATARYLECINLFNNEFSRETAYKDCKKASELLSESRENLTKTIDYLRDKKAFTEEFTKNFDEIRNSARSNLEMVNRNLEILGRYQKKLAVASAKKQ